LILLDTSILLYFMGSGHPLRERSRLLIQAHEDGRISAATTIEAIQEFAHVHARRRSRAVSVIRARHWISALDLIAVDAWDLEMGLSLFEQLPRLGAFDAVLAAVALNHNVEALVSADRAFGDVPGLRWVDPGSPALDALISG
jgi:uncharacterized protein